MNLRSHRIGYGALVGAGVAWGSSFSFVRLAVAQDSLGAYLILMGISGMVIGWIVGVRWHLDMRIKWSKELVLLLSIGGIFIPICLGLGEKNAPSYLAGMIVGSVPVWTSIVAHWVFKDKSNFLQWIGAVLALAGLAGLLWGTQSGGIASLRSILLLCGAATGMIVTNLLLRLLHTTPVHQTVLVTSFGTVTAGVLISFFLPFSLTLQGSGMAIITGILVTSGSMLFFVAIHSVGITRAVAADYISPLVASLIGILILKEVVGPSFFISALLILLGVALVITKFPKTLQGWKRKQQL